MWKEVMKKGTNALQDLNSFEFRDADSIPEGDYQFTTLRMVFDCKQDMQQKTQLVVGEHLVELLDNKVYSSIVNGISIKMLHIIAQSAELHTLHGNIGNAIVSVYTTKMIYTRAGLGFGQNLCGKIVIIRKTLYGLATLHSQFHDHLAYTLGSMGFSSTLFDCDV
eukprot:1404063-Ditylum_brightwellii.AAC.2